MKNHERKGDEMKIKIIISLVVICVALSGCSVAEDDENDKLNISGESIETEILEIPIERQEPQSAESANEKYESNSSKITEGTSSGVESCYDDPNNPVKDPNYSVGEPVYENQGNGKEETESENNENNSQKKGTTGARKEGCYDDPNNPVKDQNYNVGEPRYE